MNEPRPAFARREVLLAAGLVGLVLLALSGRYGYHRDELYFLEAGKHLAWGYPDQPPLVPLLARITDWVDPGSLVVLRLPATCATAAIVALTGLMARDLGASRRGQILAACSAGSSGIVLGSGHLLSTTTIALLGWVLLTSLLVRTLTSDASENGSRPQQWLMIGVVAGLTMQANPLVATFVVVFGVSLLAVGPRRPFKTLGPYLAAIVALAIVLPYLVWQARHGWPQLDVARGIAAGRSGSSTPRVAFLPLQLLLIGPWLTPIWIAGLWRLSRRPALRSLALTYLVLLVVFLAMGGKAYYLSGIYPVLLAAGAQPVLDRLGRWCTALLAFSLPALVFALPVLPVHDAGWVVKLNHEAGETIGWPELVRQVATTYRTMPSGTAILTENYGEAGALDRYGPQWNLPEPYSGHMAYAEWGPPPQTTTSVLAIGMDPTLLRRAFASVRSVGVLRNPWGIKNDENGTIMYQCEHPILTWKQAWPLITHY